MKHRVKTMSTLQDDLGNLLEIQSLEMKIKAHLDTIKEEKSRLNRVEKFREAKTKRREEVESEIKNLNDFINKNEKEIFSIESKLKQTESHLAMVSTQQELGALENELKSLKPKLEELQDHGLAQLERLEDFENEAIELQEFLNGSSDTIKEIESEIEDVKNVENKHIEQLKSRINLLVEQTSKEVYQSFHQLNQKYQYNKPVTFLMGKDCRECRFQVDQGMILEIERFTALCFCHGCGRILTTNHSS